MDANELHHQGQTQAGIDTALTEVHSSIVEPVVLSTSQEGVTSSSRTKRPEGPDEDATRAEIIDVEVVRQSSIDSEAVYSIFTRRQKIFITAMASFGSFFSSFTGNVYLPAINTLAGAYDTTVSKINLSITTYMILQAIAPMFTGDFGDQVGRRPAIVLCFVIYLAANIGLALQDSYGALLAFRCIQSAGSSGTVALARAVIADVITPAERGTYLGTALAGVSFAPALAPIIGGVLASAAGWRWIFWFLTILTGVFLLPYLCFMPETNRKIVGDGSIKPTKWFNMSLMDIVERRRGGAVLEKTMTDQVKKPKFRPTLAGPWRTITLFREKDIAIISLYGIFLHGALYACLISTPAVFSQLYGLDDLQVGLCYLPIGVGCSVAGLVNGRMLDWNWRRVARKNNLPYDKRIAHDLKDFPVERARLQVTLHTIIPGILCLLPYGWALQNGASLPVPLILQFVIGWSFTSCSNTTQNLTVDLFPEMAATISANNNLSRCLFGAGTAAAINPMLEHLGWGWTYTFIGLCCTMVIPLLLWEMKSGPKWREERRIRMLKEEERKERKRAMSCLTSRESYIRS